MPRIRTIKPDAFLSESLSTFLHTVTARAIAPTIHFDAPLPRGRNPYAGLAPMADGVEYVYLLSDADRRLLYVGRSFRPADRFTKHRRKPWWAQVDWLTILRIEAPDRREAEACVDRLERLAIRRLRPAHNIAGVMA